MQAYTIWPLREESYLSAHVNAVRLTTRHVKFIKKKRQKLLQAINICKQDIMVRYVTYAAPFRSVQGGRLSTNKTQATRVDIQYVTGRH
jgi:hypothetical protein